MDSRVEPAPPPAPPAIEPAYPHDEKFAEKTQAVAADDSLGTGSVKDGHDVSASRDAGEKAMDAFGGFWAAWGRHIVRGVIQALFTGWWIASLVLHRHDKNWIIPFLLWLAITIRVVTLYTGTRYVMTVLRFAWNHTCAPIRNFIPAKFRSFAAACLVVATIIAGTFGSKANAQNGYVDRVVSCVGLAVAIFAFWVTSRNRKAIVWHTVIVGMLMQFIVALFVLRTTAGFDIFQFISGLARDLLGFAGNGVAFLTETSVSQLGWFLISVLPAIIFFISLVSILNYYGVTYWFVKKAATFFFWAMKCSGAEAVVAAATPFIGQGESAMLIKPFVAYLTSAEIHQVMTCGFATISGSVLVAYIGMGVNPQALISSCVMSIPASISFSKLRYPETEESLTRGSVQVVKDKDSEEASNALHAFANGTWLGLKIAGMIMATQMCIIATIALVDGLLGWWGHYLNINSTPLSLHMILGYICYPISFLLGVSRHNDDIYKVAQLIGIKTISNEFVAYSSLQTDASYATLSERSRLIATYALCSFANIGSLGTQIGVLQQIAPGRAGEVSKLAVSALITGTISTLSSATVAGMVIQNQSSFVTNSTSTA